MEKTTNVSRNGIGFFNALTLIFIVLKLTKVISWSWVWVLAPTWLSLVVGALLFCVAVVLMKIGKKSE